MTVVSLRLKAILLASTVVSFSPAVQAEESGWRYCIAFTTDQSTLLISPPIASQASFTNTALRFAGVVREQGFQINDARCRQSQSQEEAELTVKQQIELIVKLGKKAVRIDWTDRRGSGGVERKLVWSGGDA